MNKDNMASCPFVFDREIPKGWEPVYWMKACPDWREYLKLHFSYEATGYWHSFEWYKDPVLGTFFRVVLRLIDPVVKDFGSLKPGVSIGLHGLDNNKKYILVRRDHDRKFVKIDSDVLHYKKDGWTHTIRLEKLIDRHVVSIPLEEKKEERITMVSCKPETITISNNSGGDIEVDFSKYEQMAKALKEEMKKQTTEMLTSKIQYHQRTVQETLNRLHQTSCQLKIEEKTMGLYNDHDALRLLARGDAIPTIPGFEAAPKAVKEALAKKVKRQQEEAAEAAAEQIMDVLKAASHDEMARAEQVRHLNNKIKDHKRAEKKRNAAVAYAEETGNYLPLANLLNLIHEPFGLDKEDAALYEIPKNWVPAAPQVDC